MAFLKQKIYNQYFSTIYSDSIAYNYDPYPFLNQLIMNGKANGFTNTTGFCADYAKVANRPEISLPQCGVPVSSPASPFITRDRAINLAFFRTETFVGFSIYLARSVQSSISPFSIVGRGYYHVTQQRISPKFSSNSRSCRRRNQFCSGFSGHRKTCRFFNPIDQ
jgi:hypothetical protein